MQLAEGVGAAADQLLGAEPTPGQRRRQIALPQMHAIGIHRQGDIDAVVHQKQSSMTTTKLAKRLSLRQPFRIGDRLTISAQTALLGAVLHQAYTALKRRFHHGLELRTWTGDQIKPAALQLSSATISLSEQLDSLSYRTITVGFLLLSIGIVSGAVWANEAWGSWWSWDPKETWALICWLVYAAYLHTRLSRGWQGRRPAMVAVAGLVVICVCYIGVNLLGIGLHSYGWFLSA
jgi:ABC-type transport system involved in cytochrome c biogenesis permease subunit